MDLKFLEKDLNLLVFYGAIFTFLTAVREDASRTLWSEVSFRVCSGLALASGLNDNKNDLDEENSPSSRETSQLETPQTNRHKKRCLNGRFTKASYVGKVIEPMANGLAAKRRLDENEPPTKRQTREDKAQYIVLCEF